MGLDSYLTAKSYVGYGKEDACEALAEAAVNNGIPMPGPLNEIKSEAAYWRKANAIHQWFVSNVQDGEDECKPHYVSREQLQDLINVCREILRWHEEGKAWKDLAKDTLPSQAGFFFGGTEYDEWYLKDLQSTIDQLMPCLNEKFEHVEFEYCSSW